MKIAFAFTNFPSSGDLSNVDRVSGLADLGHDVTIFALAPERCLAKVHERIDANGLLKKTIYYGGSSHQFFRMLANDYREHPVRMIAWAQKALTIMFSTQARMPGRPDYYQAIQQSFPNAYRLLRQVDRGGPPDIFNAFDGAVARKLVFLKNLYPRTKYVATFVGFDFSSKIRAFGFEYYVELFQKADLILTKSRFSRDCLIEIGCPAEKVTVHYNGVDINAFSFRPRFCRNSNHNIHIVVVARLVEKKNHRVLLEAFAKLARKYSHVVLHIVGKGRLQEQLEAQIRGDEFLQRQVRLHGWITQNEVIDVLAESHIFVLPSVAEMRWAEMEDTPTALIEAQAMGLPVISTYHAGIPEIVVHGKSGLLVPERDSDALFSAMDQLVSHPESWVQMGKNGRQNVEVNFNNSKTSRQLESIYKELIEKDNENCDEVEGCFEVSRTQSNVSATTLETYPSECETNAKIGKVAFWA